MGCLGSAASRARALLRCPARGRGRAGHRRARLPASVVVLRQPAVHPRDVPAGALSRPADRLFLLPGAAKALPQRVAGYRRASRHGPGNGDSGLRGAAAVPDRGLGGDPGCCPGAVVGLRASDGAFRPKRHAIRAASHLGRGANAVAAGAVSADLRARRTDPGVGRPGSRAGNTAADCIRPVPVRPAGQASSGQEGAGEHRCIVRDGGAPATGLRLVV